MSDTEKKQISLAEFRAWLIIVAPAYWISIALLYNGTFWNSFGINVLEYASLADIATMSILPVAYSVISVAVGITIGTFFSGVAPNPRSRMNLLWLGITLVVISTLGLVIGATFAALIALSYARKMGMTTKELLESSHVRELIFSLLVFVTPMGAVAAANGEANRVTSDSRYTLVAVPGERSQYRYIGVIGNKLFVLEAEDESVRIYDLDEISAIQLSRKSGLPDTSWPIVGAYQFLFGEDDDETSGQ